MIRRILAAVAGYILFVLATLALFALTGRDPHAPQDLNFVVLSTVYGIVFAAIGGYVAAVLAGTKPLYEGKLVAAAIAVGALISMSQSGPAGIAWSQILAIALMAPAAVFGGRLRQGQTAGSTDKGGEA